MDNEIINNKQATKHETRLSSSSSSSESSTDTIDKDKLVTETKVSLPEADIDDKKQKHDKSSSKTVVQGYDPNRIPASVFTSNSKPGTPMEWSVASNESLFSIHMGMGNNSFSRDHVFMLYRSGEFPPIPMDSNERKSQASSHNSKLMSEEDGIVLEPELPKNHGDEPRISCSSIQSFQFPLLEAGGNYSTKEAENWRSPKCSGLSEQQKRKTEQEPQPQPRPSCTPRKRPAWLSFFACCSAAP